MKSIAFVIERVQATSTNQLDLSVATPPWVWAAKPAQDWGTDVIALDQLRIDEINKRAEWRAAAATWDLDLAQAQRITRDVKREGLHKYREQPKILRQFRTLRTDARGRDGMYNQGEDARSLWSKADSGWVFDPEIPLSLFGSVLASSLARKTIHSGAYRAWRLAASALMTKAEALDKDCVAWYAAATSKFKQGTAQGDAIRSTVPTTYNPPPPVGQAVISNIMVSGATIHFDCTAPHATRFTYLHKPPGSPVFSVLFTDSPLSSLTLNDQPAGLHRFQAIPRNSGGEGQESEVVEITVAQQEATA